MKALATVALVGLAFGFEDHEFAQSGSSRIGVNHKNSTSHAPKPIKSHMDLLKNHTKVPTNKNHTKVPDHKNSTKGPQKRFPLYGTRKPIFADVDDELFADEDDEFFSTQRMNNTQAPTSINFLKNPHIYYKRNHTQTGTGPEHLRNHHKKISQHLNIGTPLRTNITRIPHNRNAIHVPHLNFNRTRPFAPRHLAALARVPVRYNAHDDEELFDLEKLLADASKTVGDVKQKPKNYGDLLNDAINIVKDIKQKDDDEDNVLFDLQKLLADASKTVGDVKQNPKNYGELLNDAINIAKDIKRKDDFEDSNFLRPVFNPEKPRSFKDFDKYYR